MALPFLAKIGIGAGLAYFFGRSKDASAAPAGPVPVTVQTPSGPVTVPVVPSPTQVPVAQRMATVLASGNPAAIRFEAGRLRQEGYPAQALELEKEAARLEKAAVASAPSVGPLPAGAVTSPGFVPQPAPAAPTLPQVPTVPVTVQTPSGPVTVPVPAAVMPQAQVPSVTVQTPMGPVSVPAPTLPPVQTAVAAAAPLVPLPVLAEKEVLDAKTPGQKGSVKVGQWQAKLASLGLLQAADVAPPFPFGPKTTAATKVFQGLANTYLKRVGSVTLPTTGEKITALKVDGVLGNRTLGMAMLAHPPKGSGASATYFGSLEMDRGPMPASPLPGIVPPMAPTPIPPEQALASRLAFEMSTKPRGEEDRQLVQLFQAKENLKTSGMYNASTAAVLAEKYGIVPPSPRYWTDSHTRKSKANYRAMLLRHAESDPQRREEWEQAARAV